MKARDYQERALSDLRRIFPNEKVEKEWDSVKYDPHISNHKDVYAPRIDITVGPFNDYFELDVGTDITKRMQYHPFTRRLIQNKLERGLTLRRLWNSYSRCFMAIEIEFNGTSKHILGSMINASVTGSVGIIITNKSKYEVTNRLFSYFLRLESLERLRLNTLGNLFIFEEEEFLDFLSIFLSSNHSK